MVRLKVPISKLPHQSYIGSIFVSSPWEIPLIEYSQRRSTKWSVFHMISMEFTPWPITLSPKEFLQLLLCLFQGVLYIFQLFSTFCRCLKQVSVSIVVEGIDTFQWEISWIYLLLEFQHEH